MSNIQEFVELYAYKNQSYHLIAKREYYIALNLINMLISIPIVYYYRGMSFD